MYLWAAGDVASRVVHCAAVKKKNASHTNEPALLMQHIPSSVMYSFFFNVFIPRILWSKTQDPERIL